MHGVIDRAVTTMRRLAWQEREIDRRFLADERNEVGRAARPMLGVLALASVVSLGANLSTHAPTALVSVISIVQIGLGTVGYLVLPRVRVRHRAALAFFATLLVLQGPILTIALDPALGPSTLGYLTFIPIAVAVFLPWSTGVHLLWLGGVMISTLELVVLLAPHRDWPVGAEDVIAPLIVASFVSVAGNVVLRRRRLDSYLRFAQARQLRRFVHRDNRRLSSMAEESAASARTDPLTGTGNRLALEEDLRAWGERADDSLGCILLVDLDLFKEVNDRLGHAVGDAVLREVAVVLEARIRSGDRVYRYGGEEFLVLLRGTGAYAAVRSAERIRRAVRALGLANPGNPPSRVVTASIGVAQLATSPAAAIDNADAALYQAKRTGRDRVVAWQPGGIGQSLAAPGL